MTTTDTYRLITVLANAAFIAFNGVFPAVAGLRSPLAVLPFIALCSALLVGSVLAEERGESVRFWVFSAACLVAGLGF